MKAKFLIDKLQPILNISEEQCFSHMVAYRLLVLRNTLTKLPSNIEGFYQRYIGIPMRTYLQRDGYIYMKSTKKFPRVYLQGNSFLVSNLNLGIDSKFKTSYVPYSVLKSAGTMHNERSLYYSFYEGELYIKLPSKAGIISLDKLKVDMVLTDPRDYEAGTPEQYDFWKHEFPMPDSFNDGLFSSS